MTRDGEFPRSSDRLDVQGLVFDLYPSAECCQEYHLMLLLDEWSASNGRRSPGPFQRGFQHPYSVGGHLLAVRANGQLAPSLPVECSVIMYIHVCTCSSVEADEGQQRK